MFEEYQICPYTGLRSFTEEESLYFKGREEHIEQATEQLQRNKFLMLTGASGDGKSSLVYAGIVPNARAGFLKSKYTQWAVADFRPERGPFQNLCKAVGRQLGIANVNTVESELQHGFSALVDLYKNSKRFVDTDSVAWKQANETGKATLKREAANLIILVDQFEEFFTNPENYHQGVPSRDSNLVLNILLETARIALEEDLPIYVVFTMRSDFIGQCAAFRGLPEYIGFSQFFVPRLNRSQLQQVIEEPAVLSGNRITRRLTERLIHDITDGVDQLPILQHALNQIWHAANSGKEEMDLVHYAIVGGMGVDELQEAQAAQFKKWFDAQSTAIKAFYREPNLQNVLDAHTNKLYEQAAAYYTSKTGKPIFEADAKAIIKNTFTCLTKIDQSRAVRNRMTLQEIAHIFGRAEFDANAIGIVLNIFREPGNTFIRPFITDEPESHILAPDQVLDITHESLIRNWEYLGQWAKEEFDSYSVSLDFGQQLNRWVKSNKASAHLFSIGPLTYFESWYTKVKPNAWWIARYLPEEIDQERKWSKANRILSNSKEFLEQSARKHAITRAVMHYGPKRIAAVVGIFAVVTLSSFGLRNYLQRQNSAILKSIQAQTILLTNSPKVLLGDKVTLIAEELKLSQSTVAEVVNAVTDPVQKINIATGIATLLVFQGRAEPKKEIMESLSMADSLLESHEIPKDTKLLASLLKEMNDLRVTLELAHYYKPDSQIDQLRKKNAKRSAQWANYIATKQPANYNDIQEFSLALENGINYLSFSKEELKNLTTALSPFESKSSTWTKENFEKDKLLVRGSLYYGYQFNGLYQFLASLYAAQGNSTRALQCVDTLMRYGQNYYLNDYASNVDDATNIAAVFYLSGETDNLNDFVSGYCARKKISEEEFYSRLLGRTLHAINIATNLDLYWWTGAKSNLNLQLSSRDQLSFFYAKYREVVQATIQNPDQRNFLLAVSFKNEGISKSLNKEQLARGELTTAQYFDKAVEHYKRISPTYLEQPVKAVGNAGADEIVVPRKYFFVYPDIKTAFHPLEPRSFFFFYSTDVFIEYILDNNLFNTLYPSTAELEFISQWLLSYNSKVWAARGFVTQRARTEAFKKLETAFAKRKNEKADINWLYLYLGFDEQKAGNKEEMLGYYRKLDAENIFNTLRSKEYGNNINNQSFRLIGYAIKAFTTTGHFDEAYQLLNAFKKPINRSTLYAFVASELLREKSQVGGIQQLLDSANAELGRVTSITEQQPHRHLLGYSLLLKEGQKNSAQAYQLIKNLQFKFLAIAHICRAYGSNDQLYLAKENIPANISDTNQADFLAEILYGMSEQKQLPNSWLNFISSYQPGRTHWIFYIDEGI